MRASMKKLLLSILFCFVLVSNAMEDTKFPAKKIVVQEWKPRKTFCDKINLKKVFSVAGIALVYFTAASAVVVPQDKSAPEIFVGCPAQCNDVSLRNNEPQLLSIIEECEANPRCPRIKLDLHKRRFDQIRKP
jgi:hypothetical protein